MRLRVNVEYASTVPNLPDRAAIEQWVRAALEGHERNAVEIGVRVVDEEEIAELNRRFRKQSGSTNVLAFPFADPPEVRTNLLGDIVVCAPLVRREAQAQGKHESAHWAHVVVHGTMHLRGYDHRMPGEADVMESLEKRVLEKLGFPDPYAST